MASITILSLAAIVAAWSLLRLYSYFTSPIRNLPGPLLARFNRLWLVVQIWRGQFHHQNIALHRRYGPIVQVAPGMFSLSGPDKTVYGIASQFRKSDWYEGLKHPSPDRWTLFPDQDIRRHAETRRRFQHLYSMTTLLSYESYCDTCTEILVQKLGGFAKGGEVIDMAHWFQCYAFDVIGEITYSKRFGFLDAGVDVNDTMGALQRALLYSSVIGFYPQLHAWAYRLLERYFPKSGAAGRAYIMNYVQQRLEARRAERQQAQKRHVPDGQPEDFLDKMFKAHDENPQKVTEYHVYMMGLSNILAGSDTTAVSLSSILYYLLRYPRTLDKLRQEIKDMEAQGMLVGTVSFKESQQMPYLQAAIKEALRMHAATGLPLWRVVPDEGAEVMGQYFPAGSIVGINSWVAHYDEHIFEEPEVFRPERWIDAEERNDEHAKVMEAFFMPVSDLWTISQGVADKTCSLDLGLELVSADTSPCWKSQSWCLSWCDCSTLNWPCQISLGRRSTIGLSSPRISRSG